MSWNKGGFCQPRLKEFNTNLPKAIAPEDQIKNPLTKRHQQDKVYKDV